MLVGLLRGPTGGAGFCAGGHSHIAFERGVPLCRLCVQMRVHMRDRMHLNVCLYLSIAFILLLTTMASQWTVAELEVPLSDGFVKSLYRRGGGRMIADYMKRRKAHSDFLRAEAIPPPPSANNAMQAGVLEPQVAPIPASVQVAAGASSVAQRPSVPAPVGPASSQNNSGIVSGLPAPPGVGSGAPAASAPSSPVMPPTSATVGTCSGAQASSSSARKRLRTEDPHVDPRNQAVADEEVDDALEEAGTDVSTDVIGAGSSSGTRSSSAFDWTGIRDPIRPDMATVARKRAPRAPRDLGLTLPQARKIKGFVEYEEHCRKVSVKSSRAMKRQARGAKSTSEYLSEHSHVRTLRRVLAVTQASSVFDVAKPTVCKDFCDRLLKRVEEYAASAMRDCGSSPKTVLNLVNYYSGLLKRLDQFARSGQGEIFGHRSTVDADLSACQALLGLTQEQLRAQVSVQEQEHHFQDYWKDQGRWISSEDWVLLGRTIPNRLRMIEERWDGTRRPEVASVFQSLLLFGLAVLCPTLRASVYLDLTLGDVQGNHIRITEDKAVVASGASSGSSRPFRFLPVHKDLLPRLVFWCERMRPVHMFASQPHEFIFISDAGAAVTTCSTLRSWSVSISRHLLRKQITLIDLRHLRCTFAYRLVRESILPQAQQDALLEAQANVMGHTLETMKTHYVIKDPQDTAQHNGALLSQLTDILGL